MTDLFGNEITEPRIRFTPSGRKRPLEVAKGYAARPGSGPQGETCRTCQHAVRRMARYWKCALLRQCWSGCLATDIRLKAPACSHFSRHQPCNDCAKPLTAPTAHMIYDTSTKQLVTGLCAKCVANREASQNKNTPCR